MSSRRSEFRSLGEPLLLAGVVEAVVKNGDLTVTGDKGDDPNDQVQIKYLAPGSYEVRGLGGTQVKTSGGLRGRATTRGGDTAHQRQSQERR